MKIETCLIFGRDQAYASTLSILVILIYQFLGGSFDNFNINS